MGRIIHIWENIIFRAAGQVALHWTSEVIFAAEMDSDGYDSDKTQPGDRDFDPFAASLLSENTKNWFNFKNSFVNSVLITPRGF